MPDAESNGGAFPRVRTGSAQSDHILGGGFPANSITILMGHPGTGKTIFAEQLLFHNAGGDRPVLYLSTLSEPISKVVTYLQRFDFFDPEKLGSQVIYEDMGEDLLEKGVDALGERVRAAIKQLSPKILVIDSFKALHDLSISAEDMRRMIFQVAGLLAAYEVTTFLVGEYDRSEIPIYPEFAIADGIVELARDATSQRDERHLRVLKLRGSTYVEGQHAFRLTPAGLDVHPRLVTPTIPPGYAPTVERAPTGVAGLDRLLEGGLWAGSNALLTGAAGSGKTTFGLSFALEGVRRGEPSLFLNLQENPVQLQRSIRSLGVDPDQLVNRGLHLKYVSPVELRIDSIIVELFETVRRAGIRRVVIDALDDLGLAARDAARFHDYLYSLVQHLAVQQVTSLMTSDRLHGLTPMGGLSALHVSSLSDVIIELGVDLGRDPRRTLRVVKARGTGHDLRAHELVIGGGGLAVEGPVPA